MSSSDHHQSMRDGIGIDATEAELVAAEQRLQDLSPEQVVPLRPEWIESLVAEAVAARARVSTPVLAPAKQSSLSWLRRWVAAAVAVMGMQGFAAAMTVTSVGAVTAAVVLWNGANSTQTLSFAEAVEILCSKDSAEDLRTSALGRVIMSAKATLDALQEIRAESGDRILIEAANMGLLRMSDLLNRQVPVTIPAVAVAFPQSLIILVDRRCDALARRQHMAQCIDAVAAGIAAIHAMADCSESLAADRALGLRRLLALANR